MQLVVGTCILKFIRQIKSDWFEWHALICSFLHLNGSNKRRLSRNHGLFKQKMTMMGQQYYSIHKQDSSICSPFAPLDVCKASAGAYSKLRISSMSNVQLATLLALLKASRSFGLFDSLEDIKLPGGDNTLQIPLQLLQDAVHSRHEDLREAVLQLVCIHPKLTLAPGIKPLCNYTFL